MTVRANVTTSTTDDADDTNTLSPVEALDGLMAAISAAVDLRWQRTGSTDVVHLARLWPLIDQVDRDIEAYRQIVLDALGGAA